MSERNRNEFLCTWKIRNYDVASENGLMIVSPSFKVGILEDSEWKIYLHPNRSNGTVTGRVFRWLDNASNPTVSVAFQYTLKNSDGLILTTSESSTETLKKRSFSKECFLTDICDLKNKMLLWTEDTLVLCCHIKRTDAIILPNLSEVSCIGCEIDSEFYCCNISFMFTVKLSNSMRLPVSKKVNCIRFLEDITLSCVNDGVHIELFSNGDCEGSHNFCCEIELQNEKGATVISRKEWKTLVKSNTNWLFPVFIFKQHLEKANCFKIGVIKLKFNFFLRSSSKLDYFKTEIKSKSIVEATAVTSASPNIELGRSCKDETTRTFSLQRDLQNMFVNKILSDVELRVGVETFSVHKCLLAARSPVFLTMFNQDMAENNTGVVNIEDVEAKDINLFLKYIYTDSVDGMDTDVALTLMLVADKYQVLSLAEKCSSFLKSALCHNNALEVLSVADMVNQEQLKSFTVEYIVENSEEVLSLPEWPQWMKMHSTLASVVLLKLSKKFNAALKSGKV